VWHGLFQPVVMEEARWRPVPHLCDAVRRPAAPCAAPSSRASETRIDFTAVERKQRRGIISCQQLVSGATNEGHISQTLNKTTSRARPSTWKVLQPPRLAPHRLTPSGDVRQSHHAGQCTDSNDARGGLRRLQRSTLSASGRECPIGVECSSLMRQPQAPCRR